MGRGDPKPRVALPTTAVTDTAPKLLTAQDILVEPPQPGKQTVAVLWHRDDTGEAVTVYATTDAALRAAIAEILPDLEELLPPRAAQDILRLAHGGRYTEALKLWNDRMNGDESLWIEEGQTLWG